MVIVVVVRRGTGRIGIGPSEREGVQARISMFCHLRARESLGLYGRDLECSNSLSYGFADREYIPGV